MKSEAAYKGNNKSDAKFRVMPFIGKRWLYDGYAEFNAWNIFTTGVTMQGRMASFIGLEGSFMYGRDEFTYNNSYGPYGVGAYGALGYGANAAADLSFRCGVDYRGYVRDVDINRRY